MNRSPFSAQRGILVVLGVLMAVVAPAPVQAAPQAVACTAPVDVLRLNARLPNTARAIRRNQELVIVALGSSSTEGVGASSRENTYPARLARELAARWPELRLRVINAGIGGETVTEMMARFEADVMSHRPNLVIWQVGSNALLTNQNLDNFLETLRKGIKRLRTAKTDIVIMDPQFAPKVVAQPMHKRLIAATGALANDFNVGLFQRFAVMRHWISSGGTKIEDVISRDRLHMNDVSYGCIARLLADSVTKAAYPDVGLTPADAARQPLVGGSR